MDVAQERLLTHLMKEVVRIGQIFPSHKNFLVVWELPHAAITVVPQEDIPNLMDVADPARAANDEHRS